VRVPPATYLDEIVAAHRARRTTDGRPLEDLLASARRAPPVRGFRAAIAAAASAGAAALVTEVKRRSPSRGDLAADLDPAGLAQTYATAGAAALSVLTDQENFGARLEDLPRARAACGLPALRKDFTVSEHDVCDARLMGADAVLLIAAVLSDDELAAFSALARDLELDVLVEVHDERELERALSSGAELVGVNQRDLTTFEVDPRRAERVVASIPRGVLAVAESGIRTGADAERLAAAGFDALLVGEALVTAPDPDAATRAMVGRPIGRRGA
jgi:indole-3-glycerol phosphate synthase